MDKGSQHREHPAPLIGSLELYCQRHNLLVQRIAKLFHQAYACLIRLPMVDLQPTTSGADGCPHILSCQSLAHCPALVQQRDLALCTYQAKKMHPPCCEWQLDRQHSNLLRRQLPPCDLLLGLRGFRSLQGWWMVALHIKTPELRCRSSHCCQPVEAMPAPERLAPQSVQPLDDTVALGFAHWQEDRFDANVQT